MARVGERPGSAELPEHPLVSVIIPCYNRLDLTKRCLAALAAATDDVEIELVLIDNGSTDGTTDYLRSIAGPKCQVHINDANLNFAGACNQGLTLAHAPYTLLLNNDTEVTPGFLTPLLSVLRRPKLVVLRGQPVGR